MKIVISALVVILLMIDAPSMQSVFGIFYDSHGRVCNFGAAHDECQYEFPEKIPGTSNYADYHSGYKVGYPDGLTEGYIITQRQRTTGLHLGAMDITMVGTKVVWTLEESKTIAIVRRMLVHHESNT